MGMIEQNKGLKAVGWYCLKCKNVLEKKWESASWGLGWHIFHCDCLHQDKDTWIRMYVKKEML